MCGIAGIIRRPDDLNLAALERMSDAIVDFGPDASGTWVSAPHDYVRINQGLGTSRWEIEDRAPTVAERRALLKRRDLQLRRPSAALVAEGQERGSTGDTAAKR